MLANGLNLVDLEPFYHISTLPLDLFLGEATGLDSHPSLQIPKGERSNEYNIKINFTIAHHSKS
jgi:hypothetical protein